MGVVFNSSVAGVIGADGATVNVEFPSTQSITITDADDSVAIGNGSGRLADVTSSNALKVDGSAVIQPVSAVSLPLPTGAATASNQSTANTSLSSIDGKTPSFGQAAMSGATPVAIASNQTATPWALRLDSTSTANVIYVGIAAVGSLTASAAWQVKKIDQTSGVVITWAGSAAYNQVWDNRTSLTYA